MASNYVKKSPVQDLAQVTITGRIGKIQDLRYFPSGDPVLNFSVAVSDDYAKGEGEGKTIVERTNWMDVSVIGKFAESLANWLPKVSGVLVSGKLIAPNAYMSKKDNTPAASIRIEVRMGGVVKPIKWKEDEGRQDDYYSDQYSGSNDDDSKDDEPVEDIAF